MPRKSKKSEKSRKPKNLEKHSLGEDLKEGADAIRAWLRAEGEWEEADSQTQSDRLKNKANEKYVSLSKPWAKKLRKRAKKKLGKFVCSSAKRTILTVKADRNQDPGKLGFFRARSKYSNFQVTHGIIVLSAMRRNARVLHVGSREWHEVQPSMFMYIGAGERIFVEPGHRIMLLNQSGEDEEDEEKEPDNEEDEEDEEDDDEEDDDDDDDDE
jgi:hypothetical protein